jgi:hypothetical protein
VIFRAYFNRHREAPQVWSVDEGAQESEVNVMAFFADGCPVRSRYNGMKVNEDSPSAWIEIEASRMDVAGGVAMFVPAPSTASTVGE